LISCIVPVYNNEDTILHVLNTLLSCTKIDEVIAVDDCSRDRSASLIASLAPEVRLIRNPSNLGKGGAVVEGLRLSRGETILTCDADLSRLNTQHLEVLIQEYQTRLYDMVIAGREKGQGWGGLMSKVSGERIFQKRVILPYLDLISAQGNGIEQIINYAHKGKNIKIIIAQDIGHVLKFQKTGVFGSIPAYAKEVYQLLHTEVILQKTSFARRYKISFD